MNVRTSDIQYKCDKTNIWTEKANDGVKYSKVVGQTEFDRVQFIVKYAIIINEINLNLRRCSL